MLQMPINCLSNKNIEKKLVEVAIFRPVTYLVPAESTKRNGIANSEFGSCPTATCPLPPYLVRGTVPQNIFQKEKFKLKMHKKRFCNNNISYYLMFQCWYMPFNYLKKTVRSDPVPIRYIFAEGDPLTCSVETQTIISPTVGAVNPERFFPDPERLKNSFRVQSGSNAEFFSIPSGYCPDPLKTDTTSSKHPRSGSTNQHLVPGVEDIVGGGSCVEN
jgi:hypothetical protein